MRKNKNLSMGVRGLYRFLRKHYPSVFEQVSLDEYRYNKISVDTFNYMYKVKALEAKRGRLQDSDWIKRMVILALKFRNEHVHSCFVFDGDAPVSKDTTKLKRREDRQKRKELIVGNVQDLQTYRETGDISENLEAFIKRSNVTSFLGRINTIGLSTKLEVMKNQADITVTPADVELLKEAFEAYGVPYIQAHGEGEEMCCHLYRAGRVRAVLSEDSDCIAYGAEEVLLNLDMEEFTAVRLRYSAVLDALEMDKDMFVDFCVLCGLDHNDTIPGIGIEKAFDMIHFYKSLDNMPCVPDHLKVEDMRHLLTNQPILLPKVGLWETMPWDTIHTYNFQHSIYLSKDLITSMYSPRQIICDIDPSFQTCEPLEQESEI